MKGPIPDSYWVIPERLLAGEYPSSLKDAEARAKLAALLDAGVRSFVDLTETEDGLRRYRELAKTLAAERGMDVHYRQMSIKDLGIPSAAHMVDILTHIESEMANERPVYVHCWGGIGRTGTVVGCWLRAWDGRGGDEAIKRIAELRRDTPDGFKRSPETAEQRRFVTHWSAESDPRTLFFQRRCEALLKFEPMFDGRVPFATFHDGRAEDGSIGLPFMTLSEWASGLVQSVYDAGWCVPFDWGSWRDEAFRYVDDPALLSKADVDVITKLLTAHVRADRFSDGHLADMAERGHLKAILRRIRQLRGD